MLAVVEQVLQLGAEGVQMALLLGHGPLEEGPRCGILLLAGDARRLVVARHGVLLELHGQTQHLKRLDQRPGAERRVHLDVAPQKENPLGEELDVAHLGDGDAVHQFGEEAVARILEVDVEVDILQ